MKRPWAYVCATNDTNSKTLRGYCRTIFRCGYVPVCPRLQDGQFIVLENLDERHAFNEIVRDKLLRCTVLVVCGRLKSPDVKEPGPRVEVNSREGNTPFLPNGQAGPVL